MSETPKTSPDPLPGDDWETRLTKQIARTVNHYRRAIGWTTRDLAAACTLLSKDPDGNGAVFQPTTLNNLFAGKRKSIGFGEILLFSRALGVPPVALMIPIGVEPTSEYWPTQRASTGTAFDTLVGIDRWTLIPYRTVEDAERYRVDEVERSHKITRLLLDQGRLRDELGNSMAVFLARDVSRKTQMSFLSVVRRQASALREVRAKLTDEGLTPVDITSLFDWIDLVDLNRIFDDELLELLQRVGTSARESRSLIFVDEDPDGTATNPD